MPHWIFSFPAYILGMHWINHEIASLCIMISNLTVLERHHVCKCGIFQSINNFKMLLFKFIFYFYHVSLAQEKILMDAFLFLSYMKDQVNYYSLYENCVKVFV